MDSSSNHLLSHLSPAGLEDAVRAALQANTCLDPVEISYAGRGPDIIAAGRANSISVTVIVGGTGDGAGWDTPYAVISKRPVGTNQKITPMHARKWDVNQEPRIKELVYPNPDKPEQKHPQMTQIPDFKCIIVLKKSAKICGPIFLLFVQASNFKGTKMRFERR